MTRALLALSLVLATPSFADTGTSLDARSASELAPLSTILKLSPGITLIGRDSAAYSLGFSLAHRVADSVPLYVGVSAGYNLHIDLVGVAIGEGIVQALGGERGTTVARRSSIPLQATLTYRFVEEGWLRPYLGIAGGVMLVRSTTTDGKVEANNSYFLGTLRPGVEIGLGRNFGIALEPAVGVMGRELLFAPSVGFQVTF